jgi:hypothetical protein
MRRGHITKEERDEICRLTKAGVRQSEIARRLGITAPSVSKVQRQMGLPTKLPTPEAKILALFREGWGGLKISKFLHVPANRVWEVMHKHGIRRADGTGSAAPKGDIEGFTMALKNGEGYIKHLGKRFGLGICKAKDIAHIVLETPQFRPGASKPPLSSNYPQRHHPKGGLST